MARIGTGINASLGAIDYTPFLKGSVAGSEALGRGIAALGEGAGKAIDRYKKTKQEEELQKAIGNAEIQTLTTNIQQSKSATNKELYASAPPVTSDQIDDLNRRINSSSKAVRTAAIAEAASLNQKYKEAPAAALQSLQFSAAQGALKQQQIAETERLAAKKDDDQVNELLQAQSTGMLDLVLAKATPTARAKFEQVRQQQQAQSVQLDLARSQIAENFAQARAAGVREPKTLSDEQVAINRAIASKEAQLGRKLSEIEMDELSRATIKDRKSPLVNIAGSEDKERANLFDFLGKQRSEEINPILRADTASRRVGELLAEGNLITGKTAQAELYLKSVANDLGIGNYKETENTEQLIALIGQQVLRNIKALGSGTAVSDADRIYTEKISGADITKQLEGIRELQNILNTQSRDSIDRFNRKVNDAFDEGDRYRKMLTVSPEDAPFILIESRKARNSGQPVRSRTFDAATGKFLGNPNAGPF